MARYIDADKLIAHLKDEIEGCKPPFSGRANGKSIAYGTELGLKSAISFAETLSTADVAPKSEVAKAFRQRMNEKMGKHTHLLGKEYVQRIMREIEKEFTEGNPK